MEANKRRQEIESGYRWRALRIGITTIVLGVGFLQYVLDKGEPLEWFDSGIIRALAALAGSRWLQ